MTRDEVFSAVEHFLALVLGRLASEDPERDLRAALDRLAGAYHHAEAPFDPREFADPPDADPAELARSIAKTFPLLGLYNEAAAVSEQIGEADLSVGDALDDLADIARDLLEVLARRQSTSEEDALWHFRLLFESHWGRHLRGLQLYLHERAF